MSPEMDRREFMLGAFAVGVAALGAPGSASAHVVVPVDPKLAKVVDTARGCVQAGDACVRHCVQQLGAGDTSLKKCMESVLPMAAVCEGMAKLASYAAAPDAKLRAYAANCAEYCRDCAAACKEHADHHEPCKACMDACEACAKACDALKA